MKKTLVALMLGILGLSGGYLLVRKSFNESQPQAISAYNDSAIYLYGKNEYSRGGLISLSAVEEPAIQALVHKTAGEATVEVFRADMHDLLTFFVHDEKNNQKNPDIDWGHFEKIASKTQSMDEGTHSIVLPIDGTGIWLVQVTIGEVKKASFVIRSNMGAVVSEGNDELLVWCQDFRTKKRIDGKEMKIYSLKDGIKEIKRTETDADGIAKLPLSVEADLIVIGDDNDQSIVPLNLKYVNVDYRYSQFRDKVIKDKFFSFTDRPIYKPGDKVYYKSIIRDDDDAVYSIPGGEVAVEISTGYGEEKKVIHKKKHTISSNGTIDGEMTLPGSLPTGYYCLNVTDAKQNERAEGIDDYWYPSSTTCFAVQYYQKPPHYLEVLSSDEDKIAGDEVAFTVRGNYFSGEPLAGKKVKITIWSGRFSDYYSYSTFKPEYDLHRYYGYGGTTIETSEHELDSSGELIIKRIAHARDKYPQIYSLQAELVDQSDAPAVSSKSVLVRAGEFGIYVKENPYRMKMGAESKIAVGLKSYREVSLNDIPLKASITREWWDHIDDGSSKYGRYEQHQESAGVIETRTDQNGLAEFRFTPQVEGSYQLTIEGQDGRGNSLERQLHYWVTNKDDYFFEAIEGRNGLSIKVDQEEYEPNATMKINIASEIPDRDVLLTFQRDRVHRLSVARVNGQSRDIEIPIEKDDVPNIFIQARSFSDTDLDQAVEDVAVSTKGKRVSVTIDSDKKRYKPGERARLTLNTKDGDGRAIPAEVALRVIDKAIYSLLGSSSSDIFESFWRKRYNGTTNAHSLEGIGVNMAEMGGCFTSGSTVTMADGTAKNIETVIEGDLILTRENSDSNQLVPALVVGTHATETNGFYVLNGSLGVTANHLLFVNGTWQRADAIQLGDKLVDEQGNAFEVTAVEWRKEKELVYNLEVEGLHTYFINGVYVHNGKDGGDARSDFKDTAYWNPRLMTNAQGQASVEIALPDDLTTWVASGIAVTPDTRVGEGQSELVVSKDVVIRPVLPNIIRIGDQLFLDAAVQNYTDEERTFLVSLDFDSGEVTEPEREVMIKPNESQRVHWQIKPERENEKAKLTFSAIPKTGSSKDSDIVIQEIPVQKFGYWETRSEAKNQQAEYDLTLSADADKEKTKIQLSISSTLLGSLPSAMRYLIDYPYGCVEQTTSRFVPAVIAKENPGIFASSMEGKDMDRILKLGVDRLKELQKEDGSWSWWTGDTHAFVSSYVVEYLTKAKKLGVPVDPEVLNRAENYFSNTVDNSADHQEKIVSRYALSLLNSDKGKEEIIDLSDNLPVDVIALAVMANARNGFRDPSRHGRDLLLSKSHADGERLFWDKSSIDDVGSSDATTSMALRAFIAADGDRDTADKIVRYLMAGRKKDYWSNTFATAQTIQALVDYSQQFEQPKSGYAYDVKLDDEIVGSGKISSANYEDALTIDPAKVNREGSKITLEKNSSDSLFSTLRVDEYRTAKDNEGVDHGLTVSKHYRNIKGSRYNLGVGNLVAVTITVQGTMLNHAGYLVVEDQLPAGMVPVNTAFKNEQGNKQERNYGLNYSHKEFTQNGVIMTADRIDSNMVTYSYQARVVNEGEFAVPPATASLMYSPEIYGRTGAMTIKTAALSEDTGADYNLPGSAQTPVSRKDLSTSEAEKVRLPQLLIAIIPVVVLLSGIGLVYYRRRFL